MLCPAHFLRLVVALILFASTSIAYSRDVIQVAQQIDSGIEREIKAQKMMSNS